MSPTALLLLAVALQLHSMVIAADIPNEAQAIREIERLGGIVEKDAKLPGRPVTAVRFRFGSDFGDEHVPLLTPLTKLTTLNLQGTKVCGTHVTGAGLRELRGAR